ncbi:hypothetical protein P7C73_g517, partial [Tremellales sp. Uapishka_1]
MGLASKLTAANAAKVFPPPNAYGQPPYYSPQGSQSSLGPTLASPSPQPYGQATLGQGGISSQLGLGQGIGSPLGQGIGSPLGGLGQSQYGQGSASQQLQGFVGNGQLGQGIAAQVGIGSGGPSASFLLATLQQCVIDQRLQTFYPPGSLEAIATKVASTGVLSQLSTAWDIPMELATDLVGRPAPTVDAIADAIPMQIKLALFDIVLYVDDSGSMAFEQNGERIDDLKLWVAGLLSTESDEDSVLSRVAYVASLFDHDGIQIRFMNSPICGEHIRDEQSALMLVQQIRFSGLTPLGTSLYTKVLGPLVLGQARIGQLHKPVLVIALTDGEPSEPKEEIFNVILRADAELMTTRYGPDAVSYQFAQIGNDLTAMRFLERLGEAGLFAADDTNQTMAHANPKTTIRESDSESTVLRYNFEAEQAEMMRKSGVTLSPSEWLCKVLLGPIDSSYDTRDE